MKEEKERGREEEREEEGRKGEEIEWIKDKLY